MPLSKEEARLRKREREQRRRDAVKAAGTTQRKKVRARAEAKVFRDTILAEWKPMEEWDLEELVHGHPRDNLGKLQGPPLQIMPRELLDELILRFKEFARGEMGRMTVGALKVLKTLMESDEIDKRGRPVVPASVKLQAATYLLDHVVGKPTQRIEGDVTQRLQVFLGGVMANPSGELAQGSMPILEAEVVEDSDQD